MTNQENLKFDKLILKYLDVDDEKHEIDDKYYKIRALILESMKDLEIDSYDLVSNDNNPIDENVHISISKRNKINFDISKIKEKLSKKLCNEFIDKTYEITNYKDFVKIMKKHNVSLDEIKSMINVNEEVNVRKLQNCYDIGSIDINEIKDCYTINVTESLYVKRKSNNE